MDDYIKREDVKREAFDLDNNFVIDLCDVNLIPSADVVPVRHGKWDAYDRYSQWIMHYKCSECNAVADDSYKYCPYCGAKMDGGTEDE